jgi:hypothetical protein
MPQSLAWLIDHCLIPLFFPMDSSINLPKILASHAKWLADKATGDRANLSRADLSSANLSGVVGLAIASDAPKRLQAVATAALADNGLNMSRWHTCETTHFISGWAIHQAGELGRLLEAAVGAEVAGLMLLGPDAQRHFHDGNEAAAEWLRSVLVPAA